MRVALRCDRHKHGVIDLEASVLEIKCQQCSRVEKRPVFHHWRWENGVLRGADWEHDETSHHSRIDAHPPSR